MNLPLGFSTEWGAETATRRPRRKEVHLRLALVRGNSEDIGLDVVRDHTHRATCTCTCACNMCMHMYMCMYVTLGGRLLVVSLSANSPPTDRSATLARTERAAAASECRRPVRSAAARRSTREAAPRRCDYACRTYRHHSSTVEGCELCLRGRRRLALDRAG
eukprot:scaffold21084_cov60-Phaeocystis_antarctica.AAC.2